MKKKIFKCLILFSFSLLLLSSANPASAVNERWKVPEVQYPDIPFFDVESPNVFLQKIHDEVPGYPPEKALPLYVQYFYGLTLMLSVIIAFGAMLYGGAIYITSGASPARMASARAQITAGFIGLIFLFSSYIILAAINPDLTIFKLPGLSKSPIPEIDVPAIAEGDAASLSQVPTGKIIERAFLNEEGLRSMSNVKDFARSIETESKKLASLTQELKNLTAACNCGSSECNGVSEGCGGIGCAGFSCNTGAIDAKKQEIQASITALKNKQTQIVPIRQGLIEDYSELTQAGLLMSLPENVMDYNSMLGYRAFLEGSGQKVEITVDGPPQWQDNTIIVNGATIADPATFYFDRNRNKQVLQMALRLPFLNSPFPDGAIPPPGSIDLPPFQTPGDTPENIVEMAKYIGSVTGLRPSFILGLTNSESGWNPYAGVAYTRERICYCPSSTINWNTAVCGILEQQIAPELNLNPFNPNQVRVSAGSAAAGCGGAMGAGQIMPFTWMGVKSRVSSITGHYPPSPWNLFDGLSASGVVLLDKAAAWKETNLTSCSTQKRLVLEYFGCNPYDLSWCPSPRYGDKVVALSEQIAIAEGLEGCSP